MSEENPTMSAKDLQIKILQDQLAEKNKIIEGYERRLDNVIYFTILFTDMIEKSRRTIQAAAQGTVEKPVLRLSEETKE